MPLVDVAVLGLVRGLGEAVGLSASGAEAAASVLLGPDPPRPVVEAALAFGAALAIAAFVRRRLADMFGELVRAITHPALFAQAPGGRDAMLIGLALAASAATHAALRSSLAPWQASPAAAGIGLLVTGIGLASTAAAPRGTAEVPSLGGALLVGLAHGGAGFPGASRLAAALTLLIWLGVRAPRAVDFALVLTAVTLLASATSAIFGATEGARADFAPVALGVAVAFASALFGSWALRTLAIKRRLGVVAFSAIPLGLALLAYARALSAS